MSNLNPLFTALCLAFEMRANHLAGEMAERKPAKSKPRKPGKAKSMATGAKGRKKLGEKK